MDAQSSGLNRLMNCVSINMVSLEDVEGLVGCWSSRRVGVEHSVLSWQTSKGAQHKPRPAFPEPAEEGRAPSVYLFEMESHAVARIGWN